MKYYSVVVSGKLPSEIPNTVVVLYFRNCKTQLKILIIFVNMTVIKKKDRKLKIYTGYINSKYILYFQQYNNSSCEMFFKCETRMICKLFLIYTLHDTFIFLPVKRHLFIHLLQFFSNTNYRIISLNIFFFFGFY